MAVRGFPGRQQSYNPFQKKKSSGGGDGGGNLKYGIDSSGNLYVSSSGVTTTLGKISGGGDVGTTITNQAEFEKYKAQIQQQKIQAQVKQQQEIERQRQLEEQKNIAIEKARIEKLRQELARRNAQIRTQNLRDKATGNLLQRKIIIDNRTKDRIISTTNLSTGEIKTRVFQRPKQGGYARETGGLIEYKQPSEKEKLLQPFNEAKEKGQSVKPKLVNIFSMGSWSDLGGALKKSKYNKNRSLGQKILTEPLLFTSKGITRIGEIKEIPKGIIELIKNPTNIKNVPANIVEDFRESVNLIKTSPSEGLGKVGGDIFTFKFIGGSLKVTGKLSKSAYIKVNPFIKRGRIIKINLAKETFLRRGKNIYLKKRAIGSELKTGRIPFVSPSKDVFYKKGQFVKFQKEKGIILKKGLLTESATALKNQVKLAGKRGTIVTAQADRLVGFFKRNKVIRKPIQGENKLSPLAKKLLNKFDEQTISNKEFYQLNKLMLKQIGKTPLERSLYATPNGVIRFTRLGGEIAEANWKDILRGNFTFKKQKPQVIVFPEGKISNFPKSLRKIVNKLKSGRKLNESERAKLIKWQVKPTGQWKPIGDIRYRGGIELETTLAPSETIRRVKKLAKVEINGVIIPIVQAKIIKLQKQTLVLLNKAKKGIIKKREINKLRKNLRKETNLPVKKSDIRRLSRNISRRGGYKPYLPIRRLIATRTIRDLGRRKRNITKRINRGSLRITPKRATGIIPRRTNRTTPKRATGIIPRRTNRTTPKLNIEKPPIRIKFARSRFKKRKKYTKVPVFNVYGKSRKKFVKLNTKPLIRDDALSRGTYAIDNTTSKSFKIIPAGKIKKPGLLRKYEKGYFNRLGYKLREFKIKRGRAFGIKPRYIEKGRYGIDTGGEKRGLSIARFIRGQKTKNKIKRRITPTQRKVLVQRLKKARLVRMRNLRRKR